MKRWLLLICVGAMSVGLLALGCDSDSDTSTGPTEQGDPNAENLEYVTDQTIGSLGDFGPQFDISFGLVALAGFDIFGSEGRGDFAPKSASEDTVTSIVVLSWEFTESFWFVFDFTAELQEINWDEGTPETTFVDIDGTDSVQFLLDGTPLDSADLSPDLNGVKVYVHVDADAVEGDDTAHVDMHERISFQVGYNENDSLGIVNATIRDTLAFLEHDEPDTCQVEFTNHTTITDLVMYVEGDQEGDCPLDGSAEVTAGIDLECTGNGGLSSIDVEGSWTIEVEINGDMRTITVRHGNVRWSVTEPNTDCD